MPELKIWNTNVDIKYGIDVEKSSQISKKISLSEKMVAAGISPARMMTEMAGPPLQMAGARGGRADATGGRAAIDGGASNGGRRHRRRHAGRG